MILEALFYGLLLLVVVTAFGAVFTRGYITSVVVLSVFSILTTVSFAFMQAVDVAMAEAVIGAGLMTAIFVSVIGRIRGEQ